MTITIAKWPSGPGSLGAEPLEVLQASARDATILCPVPEQQAVEEACEHDVVSLETLLSFEKRNRLPWLSTGIPAFDRKECASTFNHTPLPRRGVIRGGSTVF